jgi:uncharacterized protein YycO
MVYCPDTFRVKGDDTRKPLNKLKPGDVVLRKYVHYLDGYFIPGKYSHSSIYVGCGKIIHAVADGVEYIDAIDFLRCDGFCIMRPNDESIAEKAVEFAKVIAATKTPYDFDFKSGNNAYYCHELVATAYKDLNVEKKAVKMFGVFNLSPRFLAESFIDNPNFTKELEKECR